MGGGVITVVCFFNHIRVIEKTSCGGVYIGNMFLITHACLTLAPAVFTNSHPSKYLVDELHQNALVAFECHQNYHGKHDI